MAENKKAFVLYADLIHTIEKLPSDKAGDLFKHILRYVNDLNPTTDDIIIEIAFEPIKQQLKRDLRKYEEKKLQWSEAGKASAEAKRLAKEASEQERSTDSTDVAIRSTDSTVTVKDSVSVKGIVTVHEIQNNTLKGENHFEHIKEFYSHPYEKQFETFRKLHTKHEYENFQKFLTAMFRDFTISELTTNFDKCIGIGDWKKNLKGKGFIIIKPALEKALGAKEGNRDNMALRIKTFTNGLLDEKVFVK